jgi:hypothetical protein
MLSAFVAFRGAIFHKFTKVQQDQSRILLSSTPYDGESVITETFIIYLCVPLPCPFYDGRPYTH